MSPLVQAVPRQVCGFCPRRGAEGQLRDHVMRALTDVPIAGHPTPLPVRLPRFVCDGPECSRCFFQDRVEAAEAG